MSQEKMDKITDKVLAHDPGKPAIKNLGPHSRTPLIVHEAPNQMVQQRANDGYINATAMCKAAGRLWHRYWGTRQARDFAAALNSDIGIPISELIQSLKGGNANLQGTWVHPQVAIHLAQWLSPKFAVMVSKWVFEWISGKAPTHSRLPDHVRRYLVNRHKIPGTHFSILDQMTLRLLAPLEQEGYILPARLMPDFIWQLTAVRCREGRNASTERWPILRRNRTSSSIDAYARFCAGWAGCLKCAATAPCSWTVPSCGRGGGKTWSAKRLRASQS